MSIYERIIPEVLKTPIFTVYRKLFKKCLPKSFSYHIIMISLLIIYAQVDKHGYFLNKNIDTATFQYCDVKICNT